MESFDVTRERSDNFADAIYDSDLEARLYAEIYYSNDTYDEPCQSEREIAPSSSSRVESEASAPSRDNSSVVSTPSAKESSERNRDVEVFRAPEERSVAAGEYRYERSVVGARRGRLLARENLWSREKDARRNVPKALRAPDDNLRAKDAYVTSLSAEKFERSRDVARKEVNERTFTKDKVSKGKKKKHTFATEAFRGTAKLRKHQNALRRGRESERTSKYGVISKRTKLNMREASLETVGVSSDSDDSILEVPVPPKVQPLVIQLVDSDDESVATTKNDARAARREDALSSSTEATTSRADTDNVTTSFDCDDMILNCSNQLASSSRARKPVTAQRTGATNHTYSDDSMTESEANNWSNIAADETGATRNHDRSSHEKSMEQSFGLLWDQLSLDNSVAVDPTKDSTSAGVRIDPVDNVDNCEERAERSKRKRTKNTNARSLDEGNLSEIPEKRSRGTESEPFAKKSFVEYFFTPMSKELQAYYNDPCGNESLDLYDMQRRMPRHPRYWTILDADLRPSPKRRGKICPFCKNNAHFGKRCTEKPLQPICSMCGMRGHAGTRCPQTMCLTCGHEYTSFRQTCCRCFKLTCGMCNGTGHTRENCPDLWRRYHDTTTETQPTPKDLRNTMKSSQNLSCCNCAKRGHDATMCKQLRWSQHFPTPMYVTSYTDGPIYRPWRDESFDDSNSGVDATNARIVDDENVEIANNENERFVEGSYEIFQCSSENYCQSPSCVKLSIRLDTLKNVHLDGLLVGNVKPTFLEKLTHFFTFSVSIIRKIDNTVVLDILSDNNDAVYGIEKLFMQWLMRNDEEKVELIYDEFDNTNNKRMREKLRNKRIYCNNTKQPMHLIRRIIHYETIVSSTRTKLNLNPNTEDLTAIYELEKKEKIAIRSIKKLQCKLNLSLYSRGWIDDNGRTINSFYDLLRQLSKSNSLKMSVRDYVELVYLNNELFTFHKNDATNEAIERVKSNAESTTTVIPSLFELPKITMPPSNLITSDETIVSDGAQCPTIGNIVQPENQAISCVNSCDNNSPGALQSSFAMSNITEASQPMGDISNANNPSSDQLTNELDTENSNGTLLLNYYRKIEPCNEKSTGERKSVGLLVDLPKKKRKLYRRSAREAIQLANASNLPWLKKLAKGLSFKMNDGTVETNDVEALQDAITGTLKRRKSKAKSYVAPRTIVRRKTEVNYERFCRSINYNPKRKKFRGNQTSIVASNTG